MKCNICGGNEWIDMNARKAVRCETCGSLERTRLFWFYLEQLDVGPSTRILHIAPERGVYDRLKLKARDNYIVADFNPAQYSFAREMRKIDLTSLEEWPSDEFDLIIHIHVMEHIPCNIAYPLYHLHRMLKPTGKHLCIIPFTNGKYDECFQDIGDAAKTQRFGQSDHVRMFGNKDISQHIGKILRVPDIFDATSIFDVNDLLAANIPETHLTGFHTSTVLSLAKEDYRLCGNSRMLDGNRAKESNKEKQLLQRQINELLGSNSWKITSPLRALRRLFRS